MKVCVCVCEREREREREREGGTLAHFLLQISAFTNFNVYICTT